VSPGVGTGGVGSLGVGTGGIDMINLRQHCGVCGCSILSHVCIIGNHMGTVFKGIKKQSIFAMQFAIAYRRIWSAWGSRFAMSFEIVLWCMAAVELAFFLFNATNKDVDRILDYASGTMFLVITPIVVVVSVYKSIVSTGMGDDSLRATPLTPQQVLVPRLLAVLVSWAQFIIPVLIIFYLSVTSGVSEHTSDVDYPHLVPAVHLLFWHAYTDDYYMIIYYLAPVWKMAMVTGLAIMQTLGWLLLPLMWGMFWGLRMNRKGGVFLLIYVSWVVIPAMQAIAVHRGMIPFSTQSIWAVALFSGLVMPVIALVFWFLAIREWGKRTG